MLVSQSDVIVDVKRWQALMREHASLEPVAAAYASYQRLQQELAGAEALLNDDDAEIRAMAEEEVRAARAALEAQEQQIQLMLLPKDPNDDKNVVLEIRAGTGGEEAALFGAELLRMYLRYGERQGWRSEVIDITETEIGGVKEAVVLVSGKGVYSRLKYESGVHRVQRVPETESGGRIHTSAATVAVLPEAEDIEVDIRDGDLKIDTYRSGGAGGQHVNKTESAIRITHIPTGLVVTCQDEKSQIKNREKAMRVLKSRLNDLYQSERQDAESSQRRTQVGSGDRSERIRTYNYPQGRVTDHRINLTLYRLSDFLEGDCGEVIDALLRAEQAAKLAAQA